MASILRSSKFVRYIAGFARNVVVNTPREFDGTLVNTANIQCYCGALPRNLATQTSAQHDQSLERRLKSLDQDVRKSGRISRRDIEDILEEIRSTRSATSSQSLLVIRCCGTLVPDELPEVRTKLVQEIWNTLNKLNVPMDVSHYNALLRVYLENEHLFSPTEFLSEMESKGIEPNRVTYQRLISRYCQNGDIEGATKILEFMREKQMPVNENVFNALISGHSQAGDMDSAHGILSVMTQAGLEPSADTYTTLLCGYAKNGNMEKINQLIEECDTKEIYLLDKDYLDIIYALAINGHGEHVPTILSKVRKTVGYNQDAVNYILRLINKGQEKTAFEILPTIVRSVRSDGSSTPVGAFFIRQLIKSNKDVETILSYCQKLEENGLYENGLSLATEISLEHGNEELSYTLMNKLKERGVEIRQHFFWPLIVSSAKDQSGKGIVNVLQQMQNFGLIPNHETLRDWVLPNLNGKSSEVLALLRDANVSLGSSACGLVINLLMKNEIAEAATIASSVTAYYAPDLIRRPLTNALYATEDITSYIAVVRQVYENLKRRSLVNESQDAALDGPTIVGSLIIDLSINRRKFIEIIPKVLEQLVAQGLSISTTSAEIVENKLGENMTNNISELLAQLSSGDLIPIPLSKKPSYTPFYEMNIPQLEKLVQNLETKNVETLGYKRRLLSLYHKEKEIDKMESLVESMKSNPNFEMTAGMHAILMDTYAATDQLDKALEQFQIIKELEKEKFKIDESKVFRLAALLIKNDRLDEAIQMLNETPIDRGNRGYSYTSLVWRALNSLAEEGRFADMERLIDVLIQHDYIDINTVLLGPLIKVHIINNDLIKAMEKFQWCVETYKLTPWKNELACKLIEMEDADNLQRLTDLSTIVHGEINSLYDLVFSFVECGRIRQARKILETPGLQNRPQRINSACERFQQEGLIKPLEGLKDATRDLNYIDRSDIYYQLLLSYIKQNDADKCLGLWTQMQEEDMAPTDQFLIKLGSFLQENGLVVPFVMPQPQIKKRLIIDDTPQPVQTPVVQQPQRSQRVSAFKQHLTAGHLDGCLQLLGNSQEKVSINEASLLIEKLVHAERLSDAISVTLDLLNNASYPIQKIFRYLLNKVAAAGQVDALNEIGSKLNSEVKRLVSFDNRLCHANIVAGRVEEYLNNLDHNIENVTDASLELISSQFPRGGAYGILEKYPEFTDKFEQIAIKYANRGIVGPLNVLWTSHFIGHEVEKAEKIWQTYLKDSPRIMFQKIIHTARETQDEDLIKRLTEHLKISNVTPGAIGNAYSCYLDVLVAQNKDEQVVQTFERALNEVPIDNINRTAVLRVKEVYEKLGKPFNYSIPSKQLKQTQDNDDVES